MEKRRLSEEPIRFPLPRRRASAKLKSVDGKEEFDLDMYLGDIDFPRFSMQLRARQTVILVRLELDGPVHENPDQTKISTPHLHLYREGAGDSWAYPISSDEFTDLSDKWILWKDFMRFCNISIPPRIQREVFS
ncbi:MAG: hypothetical protein J4G18_04645 [Anaerolineae bacterium]|nr:hypothetical protein [Anaerolineae bacterium]